MDTLRCPTCAARLDPALLWSSEEVRCPYCGAEVTVPDVLASALGDNGAQLDAFPGHDLAETVVAAPFPEDAPAEDVERALADAVAALEAEFADGYDDLGMPLSEAVSNDLRRLLGSLGVSAPGPDAPIDEVEHALAEARAALERIEREIDAHRTEDLLAVVADLDPDLLDDEITDPSLYLDEPRDLPEEE